MKSAIKQVDGVEILTLQDNMIDLASRDDTDMVKRANPPRKAGRMSSILAEPRSTTKPACVQRSM